ncbi:GGDEF domain-containing protein [Thiotrichales bacterium 19S3-7]|nr:GGDEF domain-containing protein [Thiotrichales bacterium 19S3-7]MCF6802896.1 GGDEF domain-containing protein [Thiotrichales bacterium 19S3-11]
MFQMNVGYSLLVVIGLLSLVNGQINIFYIMTKQPINRYHWRLLFVFVLLFIIGYVLFIAFMMGRSYDQLTKLVSFIFLFGGLFVMLITRLSKKTIFSVVKVEKLKAINKELKYLSEHDDLTQLYRKQYFETAVKGALLKMKEAKKEYSILYIDLNRFKRINDTYGHLAGDLVLKAVANLFKEIFRKTDIIARIGGDEFVILLSGSDKASAVLLSQKLLTAVEKLRVKADNEVLMVSMSVGVIQLEKHHDSYLDAIKQADAACYEAKHNTIQIVTENVETISMNHTN